MKRIIFIIILIFSLQSLSKADDISDFQIEGMSIGDSLLDYFSRTEIDNKSQYIYPNKEMKAKTFRSAKFKIFDKIQFHWLSADRKYIIQSISADLLYKNDIKGCLKQRKIINKEIKTLFDNPKEEDWGKRVLENVDPSLQTFAYQNIYWLKDGNIIVSCRDYGKIKEKDQFVDNLSILIDSKNFSDWLNNKAWD
jgi:hypothetical protein